MSIDTTTMHIHTTCLFDSGPVNQKCSICGWPDKPPPRPHRPQIVKLKEPMLLASDYQTFGKHGVYVRIVGDIDEVQVFPTSEPPGTDEVGQPLRGQWTFLTYNVTVKAKPATDFSELEALVKKIRAEAYHACAVGGAGDIASSHGDDWADDIEAWMKRQK